MRKVDWKVKGNKIIFIVIFALFIVIIGLKSLIKDIKHNKDNWYFVEETRYDNVCLTIDEYLDKGFFKKTTHVLYEKEEETKMYTVPKSEIKVLLNSKTTGKVFEDIKNIKLYLNENEAIIDDWECTSKYFTFEAPDKKGTYNYILEVTYDNSDMAKYKGVLEVTSSEDIKAIKEKNIVFETLSKEEIENKEIDLEIVGLNSEGNLNYKLNKIDSAVSSYKTSEQAPNIYYNVQQNSKIDLVFANETKFILEEDIPFVYYYINEETNELSEKKSVSKTKDGVYYIDAPMMLGKYFCMIETKVGNYIVHLNILENLSVESFKLKESYKDILVENTDVIQSLIDEMLEYGLFTKIPNLEKIEVDSKEKTVNINYYFKTKEIDPEILHATEEFNTNIKEEISLMLFDCIEDLEIVNNINHVKDGKVRLQHEQKYSNIQIKQLFDRI